jgi:UDP-N-acetylmuramate-alanine ligase
MMYQLRFEGIRANQTLRQLGANSTIGHESIKQKDYHVVVTSSAISKNNPEIIEARKKNTGNTQIRNAC